MARTKKRTIYLVPEPNWGKASLAVTEKEREKIYNASEYFMHNEISNKELYNSFREWVKTESGWTKDEIKRTLAAPDYAFVSISKYTWWALKVGWMLKSQQEYIYKKLPEFDKTAERYAIEKSHRSSMVVVPIRNELGILINAVDQIVDRLGAGKKVMENEQFESRGFFTEVDHPTSGTLKYTGDPFRLTAVPYKKLMPSPTIGQQTNQVLKDHLQLSSEDIASLKDKGIV